MLTTKVELSYSEDESAYFIIIHPVVASKIFAIHLLIKDSYLVLILISSLNILKKKIILSIEIFWRCSSWTILLSNYIIILKILLAKWVLFNTFADISIDIVADHLTSDIKCRKVSIGVHVSRYICLGLGSFIKKISY